MPRSQPPPHPPSPDLRVALLTEVFPGTGGGARLRDRLHAARDAGADLAVLPELPLDRWIPCAPDPSRADAEAPGGPRHRAQADAARSARLPTLGGAIVRDPASGHRHNTALLFAANGAPVLRYRKIHLPDEPGFHEAAHYRPGDRIADPVRLGGWAVGVQICSDANRPQALCALAALGAEAILVPRATPAESWWRWRLVLRAAAVASCSFVISVNRPGRRSGGVIGGPSVAIAPSGEVLLETTEPVAAVRLERSALEAARRDYPGYLDVRAGVYAEAWERAASIRVSAAVAR